MWTSKQLEVLNHFLKEKPKILICSGAKRAGKTFVMNFIFLSLIAKNRNKGLSYILGGSTQASIRRNVLNDLETIVGKELKLDKSNAISLFGNKVYCFDGANADSYKKVRGFTGASAFINEATTLHDNFIKEVISRCSYEGARILMDTNPENPNHTVKKDYIDNSGQRLASGQLNIKAFHFTLFDNDKLDSEYVESIIASTPSGMFTDRDIKGQWVSAEGVVYKDFNKDVHYIDSVDDINFTKYFAGVDWGYEHFGSMVVVGQDDKDNFYMIEEIAEQHKEVDYWIDEANKIKTKYGNITFFSDSARPEYVKAFQNAKIKAVNANKSVIAGIGEVGKLFKTNRLFILKSISKRFDDEIYMYVWNERTGEPVKQFDDVLDWCILGRG